MKIIHKLFRKNFLSPLMIMVVAITIASSAFIAAASFAGFEAESGTLSDGVTTFADATASSNAGLQFGAVEGNTCERAAPRCWPTATNTGVPAGWTPTTTRTGDYTVTQDGAIVENMRLTGGTLLVRASNVTVRNVEIINGRIWNEYNNYCGNGLKVIDTTFRKTTPIDWDPVMGTGGFTLTRVKMDDLPEGVRIAGNDTGGRCEPAVIEDSYFNIRASEDCTDQEMWHGDGIQGYYGVAVSVRNTRIHLEEYTPSGRKCGGTAAFFYPGGQGNTRADIDGLLVSGGSYTFRMTTPGSVKNLKIINNVWTYGPLEVSCNQITWGTGNEIVTIQQTGNITNLTTVRALNCS